MVVHLSFVWRHSCSACVRQTSHTHILHFAFCTSTFLFGTLRRKCSHNKLFLEELMFYEITVNSNTAVCLRHYLKTFNTFHVKAFELTNNVLTKERKSKFRLLNLKNYQTNPGCDLHHMKPNLGLSWYRLWSLQHRNRGFVTC